MAKRKVSTASKKKNLKNIPVGIVFIHSTFNNTIISVTDPDGKVIAWRSGGTVGFKGTKKGTPFAAQQAAEEVAKIAMENGVKKVDVKVKGPGSGREASIRSFQAVGIEVASVKDVTPSPHNGCRPPKRRRV